MYKLIVIWETGEVETIKYDTKEKAEKAEVGYKKAFGNQVRWTGVDKVFSE